MKRINIFDIESGKQIMQMNYEIKGQDYHVVAMYAIACMTLLEEGDLSKLVTLVMSIKNNNVNEEENVENFLKDFRVEYEDIDRKIENASSMEDIFGKGQ